MFRFNKELKERIKLLEYENEVLSAQVKEIKEQLKITTIIRPFPQIIYEDGWDVSYRTLRKKYREHTVSFTDGLS